jgi:hypothetical protein
VQEPVLRRAERDGGKSEKRDPAPRGQVRGFGDDIPAFLRRPVRIGA